VSWRSLSDSEWLSGLSASVDYYNIKIDQVISVVPGLSALSKCYNLDGSNPGYDAGNSFCQLLQRDSNGLLQVINTPYLNLGGLKVQGIDLQLGWSIGAFGGKAFANTGVGYLMKYSVQTLPGTRFQDFDGTNTIAANQTVSNSFPKYKALTTLGYSKSGATVSLRWRYQNAMADVTSVTTPANPGVGVSAYNLIDLFASYDLNNSWQIRAGVTNLADKDSVLVASSQTSTDTAVFDAVGRSYYLGFKVGM